MRLLVAKGLEMECNVGLASGNTIFFINNWRKSLGLNPFVSLGWRQQKQNKTASFINQRAVCGGGTQGMVPTREEHCKGSERSWRLANLVESRIRKKENALNFSSHTDEKKMSSRRLEKQKSASVCTNVGLPFCEVSRVLFPPPSQLPSPVNLQGFHEKSSSPQRFFTPPFSISFPDNTHTPVSSLNAASERS